MSTQPSKENKTFKLKSTPGVKEYCEWCLTPFPHETLKDRDERYKEKGNMCPACEHRISLVHQGRLKEAAAIGHIDTIRQHNIYNRKYWMRTHDETESKEQTTPIS